jgi:hypothetical protein
MYTYKIVTKNGKECMVKCDLSYQDMKQQENREGKLRALYVLKSAEGEPEKWDRIYYSP